MMNSTIENAVKNLNKASSPEWLKSFRKDSLEACESLGIPSSRKDEHWKYTRAKSFLGEPYQLDLTTELSSEVQSYEVKMKPEDINLVFVNGRLRKDLSQLDALPGGLDIQALEDAWDRKEVKDLLAKQGNYSNYFEAQNDALLDRGIFIHVEKNCQVKPLLHLLFVHSQSSDGPLLANPKLIVTVESGGELSLRESYVGPCGLNYFASSSMILDAQSNSQVRLYKCLRHGDEGMHLDHTRIFQDKDSRVETFNGAFSGKLIRSDLRIRLDAPGAHVQLDGIYAPKLEQHIDMQTTVDHAASHTSSSQLYKGVLKDNSRAVFNGKVLIRRNSQLVNAQQLNKNLTLSDDVEVDTKPQMEIDADDVKCAHGATVGSIDEDQLFYLESRGISQDMAKSMLAAAYLNEAVLRISHDDVRGELMAFVDKDLGHG